MTNLEALKAKVNYPLKDQAFEVALIDRELSPSSEYSPSNKMAFELANADCLLVLVGSPNISEGGFSISLSDKASLRQMASAIYQKWGVVDPSNPTAKFVQPW
jgi:hypothetical protein